MKKEYPHQDHILEMSHHHENLGLLWDPGSGKTKATIDILRAKYKEAGTILPTLIFSPLITLYNWKNEFKKWSNIDPRRIHVIDCNGPKRMKKIAEAMTNPYCIVIVNYEAVQTDAFYQEMLKWAPEIVVADEMHLLKNHKSKRAKKVVKLGDSAKFRYGLTGTPILNNLTDIFHQYRFLDKGATFGKSFYVFQNKYMYDANASWAHQHNHFPDLRPRKETYEELNTKMYKIATRVTKEEAMPFLPPLVKMKRVVELGKEQKKHYTQMKKEFITFIKDQNKEGKTEAVVAELAMIKALRLQQICSGFLVLESGEIVTIEDNPRLKETKKILEELVLGGHKVILWSSFKHDYKQLEKICKELKYDYRMIIGGMKLEDKQESIDSFTDRVDVPVIIANRKAGGIGINLIAAAYSIVYSRNFSLGDELQSEARNHRGGSQIHEKIVKIDMVAKNTIDELVLEALSNKDKLSKNIIDWAME